MNNDAPVSTPEHAVKRSGVVIGFMITLAIPVIFWVTAALVTRSSPSFSLVHDVFLQVGLPLALVGLLLLAPLGIVILGRAIGIRGTGAWVGLLTLGMPIALLALVASLLQLSGSLGEPF